MANFFRKALSVGAFGAVFGAGAMAAARGVEKLMPSKAPAAAPAAPANATKTPGAPEAERSTAPAQAPAAHPAGQPKADGYQSPYCAQSLQTEEQIRSALTDLRDSYELRGIDVYDSKVEPQGMNPSEQPTAAARLEKDLSCVLGPNVRVVFHE